METIHLVVLAGEKGETEVRLEPQRSLGVTTKETPWKTTSPRSKSKEAEAERDEGPDGGTKWRGGHLRQSEMWMNE